MYILWNSWQCPPGNEWYLGCKDNLRSVEKDNTVGP